MENKLYTSDKNKEISLHDLTIPSELKEIYGLGESKKGKFLFIYNNPEFQRLKNENISEQQLLINLINQNRIDLRVK
jgi:hypothetical protein